MSEITKFQRSSIRLLRKRLHTNTNDSKTLMNQDSFFPDIASRPIRASVSEFLRARDGFRAPCTGVLDTMHCKDSAHTRELTEGYFLQVIRVSLMLCSWWGVCWQSTRTMTRDLEMKFHFKLKISATNQGLGRRQPSANTNRSHAVTMGALFKLNHPFDIEQAHLHKNTCEYPT